MDEYLSDKEQVERLRAMVARERLVLARRRGDRPARLCTATTIFRVSRTAKSEAARALYASVKQAADDSDTAAAETRVRASCAASIPSTPTRTKRPCSLRAPRSSRRPTPPPRSCASRWSRATTPSSRWWRACGSRACSPIASSIKRRSRCWTCRCRANSRAGSPRSEGDIHVALGETDAARTAYLEAMVTPGAELLDRSFLQMKLADLPGAVPESSSATTDAVAPTGAPTPRRMSPPTPPKRPPTPRRRQRRKARDDAAPHRGRRRRCSPRSRGCAGSKDTDRAAGRAHRVRGDARRAESVEQQGRRQVGAVAARVAAGDRRRAHLCRRLRRPSRVVRRRDRRQGVVGQDGASADGRPRVRRRLARVRHRRRRSARCSMPRRATSAGGRRSAARCSRRRPSARASSPCAPSTGGCAVSRPTNGATLWTVEQILADADAARQHGAAASPARSSISGFNNGRVGAYEIANGDPAWEVADRESRRAAASSSAWSTSARACRSSATTSTSSAITAAPSASISRPASCSGSKTCRRTRAWAPTSTTST